MALTPFTIATETRIRTVTSADTSTQLGDARIRMIVNYPSEATRLTAIRIRSTVKSDVTTRLTNLRLRVVGRGRISNPKLRAWTFSLDGHDFYVLRLGDRLTLVYDVSTEQWMDWGDLNEPYWRPNVGVNWLGGDRYGPDYGSNIVVGDDTWGLLWFLDPGQPYDMHPDSTNPVQEIYFDRITMGQVPLRGREVVPCFAVWLTTDMGDPAYTGAGVTLYTSDDCGATFDSQGTVTVTVDQFSPELSWYSMGLIGAPGRLFKIVDDGAITRIDGMEMNDGR